MSDKKDNVKWGQLGIIISVLVIAFGAVWAQINLLRNDVVEVKVDVATTKNDVSWIKTEFAKITGSGQVSTSQKPNLLNKMYAK